MRGCSHVLCVGSSRCPVGVESRGFVSEKSHRAEACDSILAGNARSVRETDSEGRRSVQGIQRREHHSEAVISKQTEAI